jgi:Bacterial membrane protein YfhO
LWWLLVAENTINPRSPYAISLLEGLMIAVNQFGKAVMKLNFRRPLAHGTAVFLGFSILYTLFFSPGLLGDRVLAFDDGIGYFLPAYYAPKTLWTDLIFGGYPIAADPQNMTWYPIARLLSWMPGSWNAFFVLAYVLAASFAYCYAYTLTASPLASVVAGLVYSMSGFMLSHMSVMGMIHAAAWVPLLLCALERLRHRLQRPWLLIGVMAFVCCFLGGHPQMSIYGIGLGGFYALFLGWHAPIGRWKYYRYAFGLMAIGLGICAIQLIPAAELSRLSLRSELTPDAFFAGSLPFWQALQYIFPWLFGSDIALPPYKLAYWGKEANIVDIATYVGLLPLTLAAVGICTNHRRGVVRFWLAVAAISFVLIFGRYCFLAKFIYYVPIYNAFRVPARHSMELALAVSVLASFGVAAIQRQTVSGVVFRRIIGASLLAMFGILSLLVVNVPQFQLKATQVGIRSLMFWPWANAAVGVPLIIFMIGLVALAAWQRWSRSIGYSLLLLVVLTIDMASFGGWFYDLAMVSPPAAQLAPNPTAQKYQKLLTQSQQRLLVERGVFALSGLYTPTAGNVIFPNLTRLWQIPVANGYSPLMLSRVSRLIQAEPTGVFGLRSIVDADRGLDLMSVQYLWGQPNGLLSARSQDVSWSEPDLPILIGAVKGYTFPQSVPIDLSGVANQTTAIALVTTLGNSAATPNNAAVMNIEVVDDKGNVETHRLLAGRDTSEQAYDCSDVSPLVKHRRAVVFHRVMMERKGMGTCAHYTYKSVIPLDRPRILKQLRLQWNDLPGNIYVQKISLLDSQRDTALPIVQINPTTINPATINPTTKWREVDRFPGGVMYENRQALPRTWLVPQVVQLPPESILQTIRTSRLPNGAVYQPETMALVETIAGLDTLNTPAAAGWTGQAKLLTAAETQVEIQTTTASPALLVLSDVNYPGWQAWVDGKSTPIVQTNYIQRGVKVPAGKHIVRFEFHPFSFKLGGAISITAAVVGLYWLRQIPATRRLKP